MFVKMGLAVAILTISLPAISGPLCALAPAGHNPFADQNPGPIGLAQMQSVDKYLCGKFSCPPYVLSKNPTLQNAMATSDQTGNKIRYNQNFMASVLSKHGKYATIGILAHELGHIVDFNNNRFNIPQAQREATADRYAGCVFALAGHPKSDLIGLAGSLHEMGASPGYPTPHQRVALVEAGYNECSQ